MELILTYLSILGMVFLVVSPLLLAVAITGIHATARILGYTDN